MGIDKYMTQTELEPAISKQRADTLTTRPDRQNYLHALIKQDQYKDTGRTPSVSG